jgi:molybdopterin-biosynthesis enzyme MoeA-like protein
VDFGVEVLLHETVPDDRELILEALTRCSKLGGLVFVTGGLGPTTDDFTREVIATFTGKPLEFHPPSWDHITSRLGRLGIPIAESNKQQCYFPKGSDVIRNLEGTANAFTLELGENQLWILPGPPREIASVWDTEVSFQVQTRLRKRAPEVRPLKLRTWQCLGKSEAELGEITERALQGSGLAIGYRAHRPFVEIKVWCPEAELENHASDFAKLESAIKPWLATKNGEDLGARFIAAAAHFDEIEILDGATGGILLERVATLLRLQNELSEKVTLACEFQAPANAAESERWVSATIEQDDGEIAAFTVAGFAPDGSFHVGMRAGHIKRVEKLVSPFTRPELRDRAQRLATELALKKWSEWLAESVN